MAADRAEDFTSLPDSRISLAANSMLWWDACDSHFVSHLVRVCGGPFLEACLGIKHIENGGSAEPEQAGLTSQTSAQPSLISVLPVA
jgi:hypothetical protein